MKTIIDQLQIDSYDSKIFDMYFSGRSFAVFDIETTGLSPTWCKVVLSGILLSDGRDCKVIQYFADHPDDESAIVEETLKILRSVDFIVTYNGRHFDIPFMESRAKKNQIAFDPKIYNLDLYLVVSGYSPLREILPNLKQKSLEIFMGLEDSRQDQISGGESLRLYEQYMQTHSFQLERQILLHNHDDLIQLYKLLPIIAKTDFHKAMFKLGFPAGDFIITKISLQGHDLHVTGLQTRSCKNYISFPSEAMPCSILMNREKADFELIIPCSVQAGALYFDARALLSGRDEALNKYPSVVDGYLIASDHGIINYMELNKFILEFLRKIPQ